MKALVPGIHVLLVLPLVAATLNVRIFQKATQCPGMVLKTQLRLNATYEFSSKLQCAANCPPDAGCRSFLYDPTTKRCTTGTQASSSNCSNMESAAGYEHYDLTSSCQNGGTIRVDGSCSCPAGYLGSNCSTPMRDCNHGYFLANYRKDGIYTILPEMASKPFDVYCRMIVNPRTYILNRQDNTVSFARSWNNYKNGFGDVSTPEYWLGLDNIHAITTSNDYEMRIRIRTLQDDLMEQVYSHFLVADEANFYRLTFDPAVIEGPLGDSLSPSNGAHFSTPDKDNDDNSALHCASRHQAGWWFKGENCTLGNPTGPFLLPAKDLRAGIPNEAFWTISMGNTAPYKLYMYLVNHYDYTS